MERLKARLSEIEKQLKALPNYLAPLTVTCVQENMELPFVANARLTQSLKNGGSRPLFDTGETRASITYAVESHHFTVGSPLPHTPLINDGGIIRPKRAKKLLVPTTKQLKRKVKTQGVRRVLDNLESAGWRIVWRAKSVLGVQPDGASPQGLPLKTKRQRKDSKKPKRLCLLFYRMTEIKVPKREFMVLHDEQKQALAEEAKAFLER